MNTDPLTSTQLDNAFFNLLTPQQKEMMADFGKNMYNDFNKYKTPTTPDKKFKVKLTEDEQVEWLVQQIMSGLQPNDIDSSGKKLLRKKFGRQWEKKLFQ